MAMLNFMRFNPNNGFEALIFREKVKIYNRIIGVLEKRHVILNDGEYASVIVWKSLDKFLKFFNQGVRLIDVLKPHVKPYERGIFPGIFQFNY